ncbi:hypothetical protein Spb1_05260 [Planctopirus ephydatiae]|uniref:Uncharacterized protein n=2 Tax=Planctopirus ephydatiae TaxID=2528019 RepID=A0A518GJ94_9PLAN|nr:hypothetical protein Spb1_05260 [Planctopirus ephydatiae]
MLAGDIFMVMSLPAVRTLDSRFSYKPFDVLLPKAIVSDIIDRRKCNGYVLLDDPKSRALRYYNTPPVPSRLNFASSVKPPEFFPPLKTSLSGQTDYRVDFSPHSPQFSLQVKKESAVGEVLLEDCSVEVIAYDELPSDTLGYVPPQPSPIQNAYYLFVKIDSKVGVYTPHSFSLNDGTYNVQRWKAKRIALRDDFWSEITTVVQCEKQGYYTLRCRLKFFSDERRPQTIEVTNDPITIAAIPSREQHEIVTDGEDKDETLKLSLLTSSMEVPEETSVLITTRKYPLLAPAPPEEAQSAPVVPKQEAPTP